MNASDTLTIDDLIQQKVTEEVNTQLDTRLKEITKELSKKSPEQGPIWLTAKEFCKRYNMSRSTLDRRRKSGIVDVLNGGGQFVRFRWKGSVPGEGD